MNRWRHFSIMICARKLSQVSAAIRATCLNGVNDHRPKQRQDLLSQASTKLSTVKGFAAARSKSSQTPAQPNKYTTTDADDRSYYKNLLKRMAESDWMDVGEYKVFPWSISGLETCVVVKGNSLSVAFDMGYSFREAVKCQHVCIR